MAASLPIASQANVDPYMYMYTGCANCFVFGWVQPDPAELRKCGKCKVLKYCGQECQAEHWKHVHKDQCKLLAKARESSKIPVTIFSYIPFSSAALPANTLEALVELIQRVLAKMWDINHPVCSVLPAEMKKIEDGMVANRRIIWAHQKTFPKQAQSFASCFLGANNVDRTLEYLLQSEMNDPLDLGSILVLLYLRFLDHKTVLQVNQMKEPGAMIPKEAWSGAEKEVGVFPTRLQELIEAFYAKGQDFPSYEELVEILCGGSLIQECSFCSSTIKVEALLGEKSGVGIAMVMPYSSPTFRCGKSACNEEMLKRMDAWNDWHLAVMALFSKLQITRCDFCFKFAEKVKRCSQCLTKNWCSKECPLKELQKSHEKFCQKDAEGRKIKGGKEVRNDVGTEDLEKYFDRVLKNTAAVDMEQKVEAVRKLCKSEGKSKEVKKSESGKVKKPKSQKTRAKE